MSKDGKATREHLRLIDPKTLPEQPPTVAHFVHAISEVAADDSGVAGHELFEDSRDAGVVRARYFVIAFLHGLCGWGRHRIRLATGFSYETQKRAHARGTATKLGYLHFCFKAGGSKTIVDGARHYTDRPLRERTEDD
jgi:hypothetical protein